MSHAPLELRPADLDDARTIAVLVHECFSTFRSFAEPGWEPPSVAWNTGDIEHRLGGIGVRTRLALPVADTSLLTPEAAAAGFCGWMPALAEDKPRDPVPGLAHLWMLFVAPARWGTGLASDLLEWAVAGMAGAGYDRARLWTPMGQARARAFYERRGWRPTGREVVPEELGLALVEYRVAVA
jgi:GNAT superfamily N-acetyltransferase